MASRLLKPKAIRVMPAPGRRLPGPKHVTRGIYHTNHSFGIVGCASYWRSGCQRSGHRGRAEGKEQPVERV